MANSRPNTNNESFEFSIEHWQDRFVLGVLRAAAVFGFVSIIGIFIDPTTTGALRAIYTSVYAFLLVIIFARVPYLFRAGFILVAGYVLGIIEMGGGGLVGAARLYFLCTVIIINLLISYRASLYAMGVITLTYAIGGFLMLRGIYQPSLDIATIGTATDWVSSGTTFIFLCATVNIAINMLKTEFEKAYDSGNFMLQELRLNRKSLEERVTERTAALEKRTVQLAAANATSQSISTTKEIGELLPVAAHAIGQHFGYYNVGIYLTDEQKIYAFLLAASSENGKQMLARQHSITLSDEGVLQKAVYSRSPQVSQRLSEETVRQESPELRLTKARATLPLIARDRVIGIIDMHSTDPDAYQQPEIETLKIVAEQLSLAIENARLFADMEAIIQQFQQTSDTRAILSWSEIASRKISAYQYTPLAVQKLGAPPERREDSGGLAIPIRLRGQGIGRIYLKRKSGTAAWSTQEQAMVEEVATQIGLALENARLLDEAQTRASREQLLGNIAARISAAVDVEAILRTTAQEIGKALGDAEVTMQLNPTRMDS